MKHSRLPVLPFVVCKVITFFAVVAISPVILFPTSYDLIWRFVVTIASAVIVGRISPVINDFFLRGSALLLIGDISYSLYLAHWPVIVFFKYVQNSDALALKDCWIAAQLSFAVAYLSFRTIEKYFIRADLIKGLLFIATLLCLSVALMIYPNYSAIFVMKITDESNATTPSSIVGNNVTTEKTFFERDCLHFRDQDYRPNKTISRSMLERAAVANERFMHYWPIGIPKDSLPDPLVDKFFTKRKISIAFTAYYKIHVLFEGPGKTSILLFGNSYAHRALFAIVDAFGQRAKEIRLLSHLGCPPFIGSTHLDNDSCPSFSKASFEVIEEMKPDIIFFIFRPFPPIDSPVDELSKDIHFQNIQSTIDRVSAVSKRIVLEYPLPVNKDMIGDTLTWLHALNTSGTNTVCHVFDPGNLFSFFDMGTHYNEYAMKCFKEVYAEIIDQTYANGFIE
ncbi:unnamed protein product [Toxocara canis]|uniref:SGNH domain-containing protein n=1 Tax=Toxocara canis TaxID=6265 RepID=A0A183UTB3_TOXCA|nr:unnamed protein product [Toxocara canis]